MTSARRFPKPTTVVRTGGATLRFYHSDSLDLLPKLEPGSVDAIVTSPPYNLGVQYRSYHDALPGDRYLAWTKDWIALAARVLADNGSLFLNVGNTPTQPWTAFDVVAQARHTLRLQNTIHWIKSIVIDQDMAGARAGLERDLAVGHYKPVNSKRFVNDCHEFIFHLSPSGRTPLDRHAIGVPYQDQSNVGRWRNGAGGIRCRGNAWFIPYETIQNRARDRPDPTPRRFRRSSPSAVYSYTEQGPAHSSSTPLWAWAAPPSRAPHSASTSSGSRSIGAISTRPFSGFATRWRAIQARGCGKHPGPDALRY